MERWKACAAAAVGVAIGVVASLGCSSGNAMVDLEVYPYEGSADPAFDVFERFVGFQGLAVYGTDGVSDEALLHTAHVLAGYLDADEDGEVDNPAVFQELWDRSAAILVFPTPDDPRIDEFLDAGPEGERALQDLYGDEIHPGGAADGLFDATLEEVLHLVTSGGYAPVFPAYFGEEEGSALANAMDLCIADGHYDPLANEPDMPYGHQVAEFHYWALTSILGAQSFEGRPEEIADEWSLYTADLVAQLAPDAFSLLTDPQWGFADRLPDGSYEPPPPS